MRKNSVEEFVRLAVGQLQIGFTDKQKTQYYVRN